MSEHIPLLRQHLKQHGYSSTTARELVFRALDTDTPQSISELIARLTPAIDRASVYRTVGLFESIGIIHRIQLGWKYKLELSDEFQAHHHHISCVRCEQVVALGEDEVLEQFIARQAGQQGFQLISHQFELQGICKQCQKT